MQSCQLSCWGQRCAQDGRNIHRDEEHQHPALCQEVALGLNDSNYILDFSFILLSLINNNKIHTKDSYELFLIQYFLSHPLPTCYYKLSELLYVIIKGG
jgi:hypothetical protein